jgi:hypothetical protein
MQNEPQSYPVTQEFKQYGSSFFVCETAAPRNARRVMSVPHITKLVKSMMLESGFVSKLQPKEATHVLRKHSTSAVMLLKLPHISDSEIATRAQHSAQEWRKSYRTEQCSRHAAAFSKLSSKAQSDITIEEALRL